MRPIDADALLAQMSDDQTCADTWKRIIEDAEELDPFDIIRMRGVRAMTHGYTLAIQDLTTQFELLNLDLCARKKHMNYALVRKVLKCFLDNRLVFRDYTGFGPAPFIRLKKSESGKWDEVELYDPRKR